MLPVALSSLHKLCPPNLDPQGPPYPFTSFRSSPPVGLLVGSGDPLAHRDPGLIPGCQRSNAGQLCARQASYPLCYHSSSSSFCLDLGPHLAAFRQRAWGPTWFYGSGISTCKESSVNPVFSPLCWDPDMKARVKPAALPEDPKMWLGPETHLDRHVVDVQAEGDALVEGELWLPCGVDICHFLGLHVALLVVDAGLYNPITDCLWGPRRLSSGSPFSCLP